MASSPKSPSGRTPLEERVARTNAGFFLREFSFSRTHFSPPGRSEVELADHVVSLDDVLLVFQFKERCDATDDPVQEASWYEKKVVRKATKQVRDTLEHFSRHRIRIANDRGHVIDLPQGLQGLKVAKVVVYEPGSMLPLHLRLQKGYESSTAGFVHLFQAADYEGILRTLVTVPEIVDYLQFRELVCQRYPDESSSVTEQALLGQYIDDAEVRAPSLDDERIFDALQDDSHEFEMFGILHKFKERTYSGSASGGAASDTSPDYYSILKELLRLPRNDLAAFRLRFLWAWDACGGDLEQPSLFASGNTGCGFVFVPVPVGQEFNKMRALENFTMAAKYDLKVDRCLGLVFQRDGEWRLVDWMLRSHPWAPDQDLEEMLKRSYPFRSTRVEMVPRYRLNGV
jgi:hypothetical protein